MARDPRDRTVEQGRGFDIYDSLMWEQRVDKEERAVLGEGQIKSRRRRERNKQDDQIRRLEAKVLGRDAAMRASTNSLMYASDGLPEKYRALNRWPVHDACLITCHPKKREGEGLVPKLRFNSGYVDAMWVPGKTGKCGQILQHRPEFYLEDERAPIGSQQKLKPWALPAAGALPPSRSHAAAAASTAAPAADPEHASRTFTAASPGSVVGCSASRTSFMPDRSASSMRFQIGAPADAGSKLKPLGRRSRSCTLIAAGDSALPRPQHAPRPPTPVARR